MSSKACAFSDGEDEDWLVVLDQLGRLQQRELGLARRQLKHAHQVGQTRLLI